MHESALSEVFHECLALFIEKYGHLVTTFQTRLMQESASIYAESIIRKGGMLTTCVGFIDATKIRIARPSGHVHQRTVYSGHKRIHCLSYQTVTTPDGLIFHLYGPVEGRQPDVFLYPSSGLDETVRNGLIVNGIQYCIYGDQDYVIRPWMQTACPTVLATD